MTLPDTRRLLQTVLAVAAARDPQAQALAISDWRQARNQQARHSHAKTHAREHRAWTRKQRLRNTG